MVPSPAASEGDSDGNGRADDTGNGDADDTGDGDADHTWTVLARGWTPSRRVRASVLVVGGMVLLVHALVGGLPTALGLTGTVEYHALTVQPDGDRFVFPDAGVEGRPGAFEARQRVETPLLDCYPEPAADAGCVLEELLLDGARTVSRAPFQWSGYTYHGAFYERVGGQAETNATLGLRRVSAAVVLDNISAPVEQAPGQVRRAVRQGSVRAPPGRGGSFVTNGRAHFLVVTEGSARNRGIGHVHAAVAAVLGAAAIRRGSRTAAR